MTGQIKALPLNGHAPDNKSIADHMREQAQWVEDGKPIRNVYVIFEYEDGSTLRNTCGKPTDIARAAGVILMALLKDIT